MNKLLKNILKRIRNGEKWLAFPTNEYQHTDFYPDTFTRQYIGFDDDTKLKYLQKKWKRFKLKEKYSKSSKKEENLEKLKIWFQNHPIENITSPRIAKKIHFDLKIPTSTIRQLLYFIIKNNYIKSKEIENSLYTTLFASKLPISLSQRKKSKK